VVLALPPTLTYNALMGYRCAEEEERAEDRRTFEMLHLFPHSCTRQAVADSLLIWSKVVQGEDGTLRVLC
jgi:hypothetical protein